jgi:hypothetical protein
MGRQWCQHMLLRQTQHWAFTILTDTGTAGAGGSVGTEQQSTKVEHKTARLGRTPLKGTSSGANVGEPSEPRQAAQTLA